MQRALRFGLLALGVLTLAAPANAQTTVLRGARVIDGSGAAPIDNATIVIRDGRITAVGPSAGTPAPSGAASSAASRRWAAPSAG